MRPGSRALISQSLKTQPRIYYAISTILPATYFIELMRGIILRGATLAEFWRRLLILGVMGASLLPCAPYGPSGSYYSGGNQ